MDKDWSCIITNVCIVSLIIFAIYYTHHLYPMWALLCLQSSD